MFKSAIAAALLSVCSVSTAAVYSNMSADEEAKIISGMSVGAYNIEELNDVYVSRAPASRIVDEDQNVVYYSMNKPSPISTKVGIGVIDSNTSTIFVNAIEQTIFVSAVKVTDNASCRIVLKPSVLQAKVTFKFAQPTNRKFVDCRDVDGVSAKTKELINELIAAKQEK